MATKSQKAINRGAARFIPLLLIAIISYSSWVVVNLCVEYLFSPNDDHHVQPRHGAGIAIIVVYFSLLLPTALTYLRLLQVITTDPGYIPLGSGTGENKNSRAPKEEHTITASCAPTTIAEKPQAPEHQRGALGPSGSPTQPYDGLDRRDISGRGNTPPAGLEKFYTKDVFVCQIDGLPRWCSVCCNWKPDRTHHCSEIDRCVSKMDHYCPWVGGIVSETSYKFFVQFVSYAALYCFSTLVFMACFVAEAISLTGSVNTHWAVVLGFAAVFSLFCFGMASTSIYLAVINCTTIENLSRKTQIYNLAVLINEGGGPGSSSIPPPPVAYSNPAAVPDSMAYFPTITYPLPSPQDEDPVSRLRPIRTNSELADARSPPLRTFAIFKTLPGENPWDIGSLRNFKQVMGYHWYDWFLPVRRSPCCDHSSGESRYELNAAMIERMKREAGLLAPRSTAGSGIQGREEHRKRTKRPKSHSSAHRSARGQNISRLRDIEESDERRKRRTRKRRRRSERNAAR